MPEGVVLFGVLFAVIAVLLGAAMLAMAIGVIGHGKCLQGSCGGAAAHDHDGPDVRCADCPNRGKAGSVQREESAPGPMPIRHRILH